MHISEDKEVTARCTAPGEKGSILFFFYENSEEIHRVQSKSNVADAKFYLAAGNHSIHCTYTIPTMLDSFKSEESNTLTVGVTGKFNFVSFSQQFMVLKQLQVYYF